MALMKQTVTLEIVYDSYYVPSPVSWDWEVLLDMRCNESIKVLDLTTPERVDNQPT
jgi:hypothetical protein